MRMDIKVGDVFVRRSDGRVWTVKKIDGIKVVLESPDKKLTTTDIYGLKNNYDKVEPNAT
jgi:hypothetical protein